MSRKNIDFEDSGALEQNHHDSHDLEYQTNTFQTCAMGDLMPEGQIDSMMDNARTLDGEEMRIGWEREQAIAQGVMRRPDERVDIDNQSLPLEMIERINGEVEELEQQYETAHRAKAAEHNREEACADDVTNRERAYETKGHGWFNAHAVPTATGRVGEPRVSMFDPVPEFEGEHDVGPRPDPRPNMKASELAAIHKASVQLIEKFGPVVEHRYGTAGISRRLAHRVADGQDITSAMFSVKKHLERLPGIIQELKTIDPFEQNETDVEIEVTSVYTPKSNKQAQYVQGTDGTIHPISCTVWKKAGRKPTLKKGDKVIIRGAKINAYKKSGQWEPTIAVTADTEIYHQEHGDGEIIRSARSNSLCNQTETLAPWDVDSTTHNWHNGMAEEGKTTNDYGAAMANRFLKDPEFGDDEYSAYLNRRDE